MSKICLSLLFLIIVIYNSKSDSSETEFVKYQSQLDYLYKTDTDSLFKTVQFLRINAEESGKRDLLGLSEMYKGLFYGKMGIQDKALIHLFESEALFKESGTKFIFGKLYGSIGSVYRHLKEYQKSVEYLYLSFKYSINASNSEKAKILNRIGDMHRDLKKIDSSFHYYLLSLEIADKNDSSNIANNFNNLGDLYKIQKKYDSSEIFYIKSLDYLSIDGDIGEVAENYSSLALLYAEMGNPKKSIENITKSIYMLESKSKSYELSNSYNTAIKIYRILNIKDSLIKYLYIIKEYDKIANYEQIQNSIKAVELEKNLNSKLLELKALKQESNFKQKINYLLLVVVVLIAIAGILLWMQIKQKKDENTILNQQKEAINHAKNELELAYNNIHNLNATKDKFFSIIAHDLKNPLGSFKEITRLLHESYLEFTESDRIEFLDMMKKSAENIYSLLENLLEWSRSQRGILQFNPVRFDLNDIIRGNFDLFKLAVDKKSIKLINNILPDTYLNADPNLINSVIRNLVSNAIKFTQDHGQINISSFEDNSSINISVSDNGIGMTPDIIEKLFRIDVNVTTFGTSQEKGTGLGLILSKEFIEKHGGKIWVESKPGVGSKFNIRLPKSSLLESNNV